jgi:hypothetical protein
MAKSRRQQVIDRAAECCEYCRLPQALDVQPFQLDHIRAQKHHGPTALSNLAWSCLSWNSYKGSDVSAYDPDTDRLSPLFNPRTQDWDEHFEWNGPELVGKSVFGRATIALLRINSPDRVEQRRLLIAAGLFPPEKFS